jgi:RHS repeat-associated protein
VTSVYAHVSLETPVARAERSSNTTSLIEYHFHGLAGSALTGVGHASGDVLFGYTPFGQLIEAQGGADHRRRFNDKYADSVSGLAYYGARYFDHVSVSWTQNDPLYTRVPDGALRSPRNANRYAFSNNNPLRYIDPDGTEVRPQLDPGGMCRNSSSGHGCEIDLTPIDAKAARDAMDPKRIATS